METSKAKWVCMACGRVANEKYEARDTSCVVNSIEVPEHLIVYVGKEKRYAKEVLSDEGDTPRGEEAAETIKGTEEER